MMLDAMSGIDSTVAVASRSAYIFLSAGAISGVWPIIAQPIVSICSRASASVRSVRKPGIDSSLSSVPPVWPSDRPDIIGTATPSDATSGASTSETLSPTPPVECLSMRGRPEIGEIEPVAAQEHRLGERGRLAAIEAAEKTRHEQRGHLIVGHVALGVRERQRAPFARLDPAAVALSLDQSMCEHLPDWGVRSTTITLSRSRA